MNELLGFQVADVMTYRPPTVTPEAPLAEAMRLFEAYAFDALPVVRDGALAGVLGRMDLLATLVDEAGASYEQVLRRPVESLMSSRPVSVTPDMPVVGVVGLMRASGQRTMPVAIGALLVGVVSQGDVMAAVRRAAVGDRPLHAPIPAIRFGPHRPGAGTAPRLSRRPAG